MCEDVRSTVQKVDQDCGVLYIILSPQQGIKSPRGVCVDEENNLYVGRNHTKHCSVQVSTVINLSVVCRRRCLHQNR